MASSTSSWTVLLGLVAICVAAFVYDARNSHDGAPRTGSALSASLSR